MGLAESIGPRIRIRHSPFAIRVTQFPFISVPLNGVSLGWLSSCYRFQNYKGNFMFDNKRAAVFLAVALVAIMGRSLNAQAPRPDGPPVHYVEVLKYEVLMRNVKSTDDGPHAEFYFKDGTLTEGLVGGRFAPSVISPVEKIKIKHGGSKRLSTGYLLLADDRIPDFKQKAYAVDLKKDGKLFEYDVGKDYELKDTRTPPVNVGYLMRAKIPKSYLKDRQVSASSQTKIDVTFTNKYVETVKAYWVDQSGKEVFYADIQPGKKWSIETFANHVWRFKRPSKDVVDEISLSKKNRNVDVGSSATLASKKDTVKLFVEFSRMYVKADSPEGKAALRSR